MKESALAILAARSISCLGGVQLAKADVVRDGAGEQVGVLQHNAKAAAQVVLADLLNIEAVIENPPALDVVEAVDEVGDGRLARAGGADKGDLLAGLCVEVDVVQDGVVGVVGKVDLFKPHVAAQRRQHTVLLPPGPAVAACVGSFPAVFVHPHQADAALVHLRLQVHGLEHPLRTGHRRQQEVALLGELVDRGRGLPHKDQVACKAAHVGQPLQRHDAAQHRHNRVVDVGDGDHRRDHGGRVALGPGARLAEGLVLLPELPEALRLVVEHLDHLLAGHHLLDEAVQISQAGLLLGVVGLAVGPAEADIAEQLQHTINSGGAKFDYFSPDEKQRLSVYASAQHTGRDSYYGGGQDVNAYGATTDFTWVTGSQYIY